MAFPSGVALSLRPEPTYGEPFITVLIGEEAMGIERLHGDPEISEAAARGYVQRNLKSWEYIGLFGPHLSQEVAARRPASNG